MASIWNGSMTAICIVPDAKVRKVARCFSDRARRAYEVGQSNRVHFARTAGEMEGESSTGLRRRCHMLERDAIMRQVAIWGSPFDVASSLRQKGQDAPNPCSIRSSNT